MTIQATITTLTLTLSLISGSWTLASPRANSRGTLAGDLAES